jgi:SNF2 family DNA or RNA helicase
MKAPTRTEFLRSRLYKCACAFNWRNEQRLKNIRDLLEKVDEKQKRTTKSGSRKKTVSTWEISDMDGKGGKNLTTKEDSAILGAEKDKDDWIFEKDKDEYSLTIGGVTVMKLPADMYDRLMPFQRDAVKWIAGVSPVGGILADDMGVFKVFARQCLDVPVEFSDIYLSFALKGLGKTFMSIASLGARMRCKRVRMALVVVPVSVLSAWATEGKKFLSRFVDRVRIVKVHGGSQKDRAKTIRNAWKDSSTDRPYVIISSWGLVCSPKTFNGFLPPRGHHWDYVILDEAHLIKNHNSSRAKCCKKICHKSGTKRLLLTG